MTLNTTSNLQVFTLYPKWQSRDVDQDHDAAGPRIRSDEWAVRYKAKERAVLINMGDYRVQFYSVYLFKGLRNTSGSLYA